MSSRIVHLVDGEKTECASIIRDYLALRKNALTEKRLGLTCCTCDMNMMGNESVVVDG